MDWNGLYLVAMAFLVGGYGWWASRSPAELDRNRRSTQLIPNLASRLPGGARAFRWAYSLFAGFFLFAGVYTVLAGHPLGGASGSGSTSARTRIDTPTVGAFASQPQQGLQVSFNVSRSAIRDSVIAWSALCQSGKTWSDHALSAYAPLGGWTGAADYVTHNANGITEHVHIIKDEGHFTSPTRASGTFALSVALYQAGRKVDTCQTETVQWSARMVASG